MSTLIEVQSHKLQPNINGAENELRILRPRPMPVLSNPTQCRTDEVTELQLTTRILNAVVSKLEQLMGRLENATQLPNSTNEDKESGTLFDRLQNVFSGLKEAYDFIKTGEGKGRDIFGNIREGYGIFRDFAKSAIKGLGDFLAPTFRSISKIFKKGWDYAKNLLS